MRHTAQYKVEDKGRDFGKVFLLTEMSARQGEEWAMKVLLALMASNVNLPDGFENLGMAALAQMGLKALTGIKWETLEPLLAEMMENIQIIPDAAKTNVHRPLVEDDIEEIITRVKLRAEVWNLNMGFLAAVAPSLLGKKPTAGKR